MFIDSDLTRSENARRLTIRAALVIIGGLSNPSKMPGFSWSLPAIKCQTGSKLAKIAGSVCASCYALKGCYMFASTVNAMARRFDIISRALTDPEFGATFVSAFSFVLERKAANTRKRIARGSHVANDCRFFRWHDSGDLQSLQHLNLIVQVCEATPNVQHWLPTRETRYVRAFLLAGGVIPSNMVIRFSVPKIDGAASGYIATIPDSVPGIARTFVHSSDTTRQAQSCIAYRQEGFCLDCRACWDREGDISYPKH